jgi:hypothetical protein
VIITCGRCRLPLESMGGTMDTTGQVTSYSVKPCHVCIGDAAERGFENGQKSERELRDAIERDR